MATSETRNDHKKRRVGVKSGPGKRNALRRVTKERDYREYPSGAVIYVGHIPNGFFEDQMRKYFSQFGRVGRIQLCRSKKTGKPKGFAFIEFQSRDVAEIAAEAMNNYLMFQKLMKCHVVPEEKLHPNLFKNSASSRGKRILPCVVHKRRHNQQQTDKQHTKSVLRMIKKKKKLVNRLKELGISYELPAEMFKRNKQDDIQNEKDVQCDGDVQNEDKEAELLPAKKQKLSSPECKVPSLSPDTQNLQTSAKAKRKEKRSMLDKGSSISEQEEERSSAVKKHKSCTPESKQTDSTPERTTVKMITRSKNKTSAKESNLELSRQTESECPEGDIDCELVPAKKQRMTPPETKQTLDNKKTPKQNVHDEHGLSEKKTVTLSNMNETVSPQNTPLARESETSADLGSRKKSLRKVTVAVTGKHKNDAEQTPKATTLLNTPVSLIDETQAINKSARKTPKKQVDKKRTEESVDEDLEAANTPRIGTDNKKTNSVPSPRITRSKSSANATATPTKAKTESVGSAVITAKHKQASSMPMTRAMTFTASFNKDSPKHDSPLQKLNTRGRRCGTPTKVKPDSTKKKVK